MSQEGPGIYPRDTPLPSTLGAATVFNREEGFNFKDYLYRHFLWSFRTFGLAPNTASICNHIRKELHEIEAKPEDLEEWIDIIILGIDGALRCRGMGHVTAEDIVDTLIAKLKKNESRKWIIPTDPTQPIEHDRSKGE